MTQWLALSSVTLHLQTCYGTNLHRSLEKRKPHHCIFQPLWALSLPALLWWQVDDTSAHKCKNFCWMSTYARANWPAMNNAWWWPIMNNSSSSDMTRRKDCVKIELALCFFVHLCQLYCFSPAWSQKLAKCQQKLWYSNFSKSWNLAFKWQSQTLRSKGHLFILLKWLKLRSFSFHEVLFEYIDMGPD